MEMSRGSPKSGKCSPAALFLVENRAKGTFFRVEIIADQISLRMDFVVKIKVDFCSVSEMYNQG